MRSNGLTSQAVVIPAKAGIQYAAAHLGFTTVSGILDRPVKPGDDSGSWRTGTASRRWRSVAVDDQLSATAAPPL